MNRTTEKKSTIVSAWRWCRRYFSIVTLIVVAAIGYMLLSKDKFVHSYMRNAATIDSLRAEIKNARDSVRLYTELNKHLSSDPELMEKVVRENYNMNRDGEDVYVFH